MQVRDLLCMRGYQWDNLRVVACGTSPTTFSALFSSTAERFNAMVIENCTPPAAYFWNGSDWESIPFAFSSEDILTVLYAHTNAVDYPLSYGGSKLVGYQNKPVENLTYGSYNTTSRLWTCTLAGWYRIFANHTLRIVATNVGRTGGNPIATHRLAAWRSANLDYRTCLDILAPSFVQWQDLGPIPDTTPQTFDIKLPQDAVPLTGSINWLVNKTSTLGFGYFKAGDVLAIATSSAFADMNGTRQWGIGGGANPLRDEMLLIERLDHN